MTIKELKLVQAKAEGKTHLQAAAIANYLPNANTNTKQVEVTRTLNKPHVKAELERLLLKHDITIENALLPIAKGLRATKKVREYDTESKTWQVVDEEDDIELQLKASDRALKLHGAYAGNSSGLHIHLGGKGNNYQL